jgi:hypothetical protein
MRIWIDLANSPQVLFFRPIIAELQRQGHELLLTTRDYAQTIPLTNQAGLAHTTIGRHGGKQWVNILRRTAGRSLDLVRWARRQGRIDLAVSHNSYTQAVAATLLRLPFVTLMDYEHQPLNHLCFRLAQRVIVPETFPDEALAKFGARPKALKYHGLKEQVYLSTFSPTPGFLRSQGIPEEPAVIVMRPPAPWTAYHRFENTLFDDVLEQMLNAPGSYVVFLPRIPAQGEQARGLGRANLYVPSQPLDGPNLLYHADLVISGGGTMNREAAVLGTPTYTVFKGQLGAVDRYLIDRGQMTQIAEPENLEKIRVEKRTGHGQTLIEPALLQEITGQIVGQSVPAAGQRSIRLAAGVK